MLQRGVLLSRGIIEGGSGRIFTPDQGIYSGLHWPGLTGGVYGWIVFGVLVLAVAAVVVLAAVRAGKIKQAVVLEPLKKQFVENKISEEEYNVKKAVLLKK